MISDLIGDSHSYGVDIKNREIYLHGHHGSFEEDPGVDYRMASTFIKNIRSLDVINKEQILIHMHSIGGNWGDGMAIYDAISLCQSYVTILVYGQAESMSSIILQAADKRVMMPNSYFMCHFGDGECVGNYLDMQSGAAFDKLINDSMLQIYTDVAMNGKFFKETFQKITEGKVKGYLKRKLKDGEWYLTSEEAMYYGFCDLVLSSSINSLK